MVKNPNEQNQPNQPNQGSKSDKSPSSLFVIPKDKTILDFKPEKKKKKDKADDNNNNTGQAETFTNERGNVSGVNIEGRTFLGLGPDEVNTLIQQENQKRLARGDQPLQVVSPQFRALLQQQQQQAAQVAQGVGELSTLQQQQAEQRAQESVQAGGIIPGNINLQQAATAGLAGVIPGGVAGSVGLLGGPVTGGVTIGAGAIGGFLTGFLSNVKSQQTGYVQAEKQGVTKAITQLNNVVAAQNLGADPDETAALYNQIVQDTYQKYYELKLQTSGNAAAFDDGTKELEQFRLFFKPGGTLDTINLKYEQALINPNPNKISPAALEELNNFATDSS